MELVLSCPEQISGFASGLFSLAPAFAREEALQCSVILVNKTSSLKKIFL
jgi:hypothetical protein